MNHKVVTTKVGIIIALLFLLLCVTRSDSLIIHATQVSDIRGLETPKSIAQDVITIDKHVEVIKEVAPFKLKDLGLFKITAYCPCSICCGEWTDAYASKITSLGAGAYEGVTVAVDPKLIPYGTKLYTDDFGVRIATDCGGAIKGNRLDLFFSTHEKALEYGVKYMHLYAIEE